MAAAVRDPMGAEENDLVADDDLVAAFEAQPRRPNNQAAAPIAMMVTSKMMYELMVMMWSHWSAVCRFFGRRKEYLCHLACVCALN